MTSQFALFLAASTILLASESAFAHSGKPEQLGTVNFATSCAPEVKERFGRGMALLHSFWTKESVEEFSAVLKQDPNCAIAYWGIAMSQQQNPLTAQQPMSKAAQQALAGLDEAKNISAKTARETDYLNAIDLIYRDADKTEFRARRVAYEKAMEKLAQRYPEDAEAKIFYALALQMTAQPTDKTYANQLKAAAILEEVLKQQPEHPGVVHYLVHSYDFPTLAERGIPAARLYAKIAPNHPHALHMPSHIFTRLGGWRDSIDSNLRSSAAAQEEGNGQEQAHALDYLVYAYLQLGDDAQAKRIATQSASLSVNRSVFIGPYALAAMPARYALERQDWKEAGALQPTKTQFSFPDAITHFARGLAFARSGNVPSAQEELSQLALLRDELQSKKNTYWANQVEVQRLTVNSWIALQLGQRDEAVDLMRRAADLEDSMDKHIVTPGAILPARELLGDMLLEVKQPAEALAAFEASAKREPNRLRGMYGIARSAELLGDDAKARSNYQKLQGLAHDGNAGRPELVRAVAYIAKR